MKYYKTDICNLLMRDNKTIGLEFNGKISVVDEYKFFEFNDAIREIRL